MKWIKGWFAVVLFFSLPLILVAQSGGTGWIPQWEEQLGIELESTPAVDAEFTSLQAKVEDPEKLSRFLEGVSEGETVTVRYAGRVAWSAEIDGRAVQPAVIRIHREGEEESVRLVPNREDLKLKIAAPPFRGSNLRRGGN